MGSQDLPKRPRVTPTYPERTLRVPLRSCPKCGGQMFVLPEQLTECYNCKLVTQTSGFNYRILRNR